MNQLSLGGIDGQHLWGFLAALGSLSLLDEHARESSLGPPRLAFQEDGAAVLQSPVAREHLAAVLLAKLRALRHRSTIFLECEPRRAEAALARMLI